MQIDSLAPAFVGDVDALVDLALAVHSLADLRLAHERGEAVLQHARTDAPEHIIPGTPFQHHVVDTPQVQELREEKSRRAAADDADLRACRRKS